MAKKQDRVDKKRIRGARIEAEGDVGAVERYLETIEETLAGDEDLRSVKMIADAREVVGETKGLEIELNNLCAKTDFVLYIPSILEIAKQISGKRRQVRKMREWAFRRRDKILVEEREATNEDPKQAFAREQFASLREMGISDDYAREIARIAKLFLAVPAVIFCRQVVQSWRQDWVGSESILYYTIAATMKRARNKHELEWFTGVDIIESTREEFFPGFVQGCLLILEMDLGLPLDAPARYSSNAEAKAKA